MTIFLVLALQMYSLYALHYGKHTLCKYGGWGVFFTWGFILLWNITPFNVEQKTTEPEIPAQTEDHIEPVRELNSFYWERP